MKYDDIKRVFSALNFDQMSTVLGIRESLVLYGIIEDTDDNYVNLIITESELMKLKDKVKGLTSSTVIHGGLVIDDNIGYTAVVGKGYEINVIDNINVLSIEYCLDFINNDGWDSYKNLIPKIRDHYIKELDRVQKQLSKITEILNMTV